MIKIKKQINSYQLVFVLHILASYLVTDRSAEINFPEQIKNK